MRHYPTITHTTVLFQKGIGSADSTLSSDGGGGGSSSSQSEKPMIAPLTFKEDFILYWKVCILTHESNHHQPCI
jgi:hypothetical protein